VVAVEMIVVNDNTSYRAMVGMVVDLTFDALGNTTYWLAFSDVPDVQVNFDKSEVMPYSPLEGFLMRECRLEDYGWVYPRD
jgi:hypothetical protein